jgi:hypothetical protein
MGIADSDSFFGSRTTSQEKPIQQQLIYVRNDSGYTIPPYGLMQPTGTVEVAKSFNYIKVKRPIDSTLMRSPLLINGPREIEVDGYGKAQNGPVYQLLHDGGTYVAGDRLGAKTSTFTATYGALFAVIGSDDIATNILRVMFDTSPLRGQTIATLVVGTPGLVYLRDAAGTLTSRQYTAEAEVSNITGSKEIIMCPTYGKLLAMEIC